MDTTTTLYWAPVVPNGAVCVQIVAGIVCLFVFPGPTSRNLIAWDTDQWATKCRLRDVVLAKKRSICPWSGCFQYILV